jgi:hypothetical protein
VGSSYSDTALKKEIKTMNKNVDSFFRIVWEEYVNVGMWIQFMFHLSAVCDKVQSFVATVTMKQCVYTVCRIINC